MNTPTRPIPITDKNSLAPITHWCRQCDSHHPMHRVSSVISNPTTARGEEEVLVCPNCRAYGIELLQEVKHAE